MQVFSEGHIGGSVPSWPAGPVDRRRLADELGAWARSEPMRELAAASGWGAPDGDDPVAALAERSVDWDFRGRAAVEAKQFMERGAMPYLPAVVNGRTIPEDVIAAAAAELGLVNSGRPGGHYDHVVVLSGAVRGCVNRAHHAARLLADGLRPDRVVALGAHRPIGDAERAQAVELGLPGADSGSALVLAAVRAAFGLGEPDHVEESAPDAGTDHERLARSARHRWAGAPPVEVVTVPSENAAAGRRADTAAQLRYWRGLVGLGAGHRVLLVTTQIYVPYQHLVGIRHLALPTGCALDTCGVDTATGVVPTRVFTGTDYLQELRSALLAARSLLDEVSAGVS